jgi:hypothetical protein
MTPENIATISDDPLINLPAQFTRSRLCPGSSTIERATQLPGTSSLVAGAGREHPADGRIFSGRIVGSVKLVRFPMSRGKAGASLLRPR